jgi:hypothetical protein
MSTTRDAVVGVEHVAGLSPLDQRVVANPFVPTREAVALLRLRAEHVPGAPTRRKSRRFLRRLIGLRIVSTRQPLPG